MISILFAAGLTILTCFDGNGHAFPPRPNGMCVMADRADMPTALLGASTGVTLSGTVPVSSSPLASLVRTVGIHGYRCTSGHNETGYVRWYDGNKEAFKIIVPGFIGGPSAAVESTFPLPFRVDDFHAKADKGIKCTLSFPMDAH